MIAWLKDFFGLQDIRRDTANMHHKPCVVREEDRRRYTVAPGPPEIPEDLKRIAKWQPGELERMSDKIIAKIVEPILLREKENSRIEKAMEFSRGYEEGKMAERERCLNCAIQANSIKEIPEGRYDDWTVACAFIVGRIRADAEVERLFPK